jgi:RHS repeat-associated protein
MALLLALALAATGWIPPLAKERASDRRLTRVKKARVPIAGGGSVLQRTPRASASPDGAGAADSGVAPMTAALSPRGVVTHIPPDPVTFSAGGTPPVTLTYDLPLGEAISLADVRAVGIGAFRWDVVGGSARTELTASLLSGSTELLDVGGSFTSGSLSSEGWSLVLRLGRAVTASEIAGLPSTTADGIRFKVFRYSGSSSFTTSLASIHADGRLRLTLATCEMGPCGPHDQQDFLDLPEIVKSVIAGVSPWSQVSLPRPVPGGSLRYVHAGPFLLRVGSPGVRMMNVEVQLILNDGSTVTLDDWESPSALGAPSVNTFVAAHSLSVPDSILDLLEDRWVTAFRWRVHTGNNAGGTVNPGCPSTLPSLCGSGTPFTLLFLYDLPECTGQPGAPAVDLSPPDGAALPENSGALLSGRVVQYGPTAPAALVTVNGEPADSMDAAGRFFKEVDVGSGANSIEIRSVRSGCGETATPLTLRGLPRESLPFEATGDVGPAVSLTYSRTTQNRAAGMTLFEARACNAGTFDLPTPLQLVLAAAPSSGASLASPDGLTGDGFPYLAIGEEGRLAPGACAPAAKVAFYNPDARRLDHVFRARAPLPAPPRFLGAPPTSVLAGRRWSYVAGLESTADPFPSVRIELGPEGMTIDPNTGEASWLPAGTEEGHYEVIMLGTDWLGQAARQAFTITVSDGSSNRAPFFTSAPATRAATGARYEYAASAVDADGDAPSYALSQAPAGATVDPNTGLLVWPFALPGSHAISLSASDGAGGSAAQSWTLTVGSPSPNPTAPAIHGSPSATAAVGETYLYQPIADDPDPNDALLFSLTTAPPGMAVDAATGRVSWTPASSDTGSHAVTLRVEDGGGGAATQSWSIEVSVLDDRPPLVLSSPRLDAVAGQAYTYPAFAIDPDGAAVAYALVAPPAGMSVDPNTGVVAWTPPAAGLFTVALTATDPNGLVGSQVFPLVVHASNGAPAFTSPAPSGSAVVGSLWTHDASAADPDGDAVAFGLAAAPSGMSIHPRTGTISFRPAPGQEGAQPVTVEADDGRGARSTRTFTLNVDPDVTAPTVAVALSSPAALLNQTVKACVSSDETAPASVTLRANGSPAAVDAVGCALLSFPSPGAVTVRGEVADASGNLGLDEETLAVIDPSLGTAPAVELSSIVPPPESVITAPTAIYATITDDTPSSLTWTVTFARLGSSASTTIGSGSGEVTNGQVAVFDPTLLPNDIYRVQIIGNDGTQTGGVEFNYSVAGGMKLGNFSLTLTDLTIPVAGIPLNVTRTYDSLDTTAGDFGNGWRLGLPGRVADTAPESYAAGLTGLMGSEPFTRTTRVYVTRPDGRRVGFTFDPPAGGLYSKARPVFRPDPGVTDTLEAVSPGGGTRVWEQSGRFYDFIVPYNPRTYVLTTRAGVKYTVDEVDGLRLIEDANDNTITVTPGGLVSSTGVSLTFQRDGSGRITRIVEPDDPNDLEPPGELEYQYDAAGNLIGFRDQLDNLTEYFYEDPSQPAYLTRIEDPLDGPVVRNVFDPNGRLVGQCGADGDPVTLAGCTSLALDPFAAYQTIINARGFRTDLFLDARGNVLTERRWVDGSTYLDTVRTYYGDDQVLSETDPAGNTRSWTYDSSGNRLGATDAGGRTTTWTYGSCNKPESRTDPAGNVTQYAYDAACNLVRTEDALGGVATFEYDSRGRLTRSTDRVGNSRLMGYNIIGWPVSVTDPRGNTTTVEYSANGGMTRLTDRNGRRRDFTYDAAHRLLTETWDSVPPAVFSYTYDAAGRLTAATSADSSIALDYWNTGLLRSEDNAGTPGAPRVVVTYGRPDGGGGIEPGHDANGNLIAVMDSLGGVTEYDYDPLDRPSRASQRPEGAASVNEKRVDFVYNAAGLLTEVRRFSNLAGTAGAGSTFIGYDCGECPLRRSSIHHRRPDGGVIHDMDLVRDVLGNVLEITDAEGVHTYSYDGLSRLLGADHPAGGVQPDEAYAYDAVGNRLSSHLSAAYTYQYQMTGGGDQLRSDDRFDYDYDAEGNLVLRTERATGAYTTFTYDHRNRLTATASFDGAGTPVGSASYAYDPLNRRIRATEGGTARWLFYDGLNPILEVDSGGAILTRRLYGRQVDGILADETARATRWALTDMVGTVRDLAAGDGTVLDHRTYDSFGRLLSRTDPNVPNALGFTAREFDPDTGLGYFRARWYDPSLGRFIRPDPRAPFGYEYAGNNPILLSDPGGESAIETVLLQVRASRSVFCGASLLFAVQTSELTLVAYAIDLAAGETDLGALGAVGYGAAVGAAQANFAGWINAFLCVL